MKKVPADIETVGEAIRHLREQRGMTLRALARKAGVSAAFLCDVEHNRRQTKRLIEIAAILDVDPEELENRKAATDLRKFLEKNPGIRALLGLPEDR